MKKLLSSLLVAGVLMFGLTGCNEQVPQGHVGKVLGPNGFQPEVYPPSVVNIDNGPLTRESKKETFVFAQTTTQKFVEPIKVLLSDKLTLKAEIVFRGRITSNKKRLDAVFNDMVLNDNVITTEEVYFTYGKMVVLNTAREVISKYNVDEVNTNYARITTEFFNALAPKLESLPMDISDVTIGNIEYPEIVTLSVEKAKARQMKIAEQEAQTQIDLKKKAGEEKLARADYAIKMLEARAVRDYDKMISSGITPTLLRLKEIEVQEKMVQAIKGNANVVYMPMDMMGGSSNIRVIK